MNTPLQEQLAQLEERVNKLEKLRWESKKAEQLKKAEPTQNEAALLRVYHALGQATKQAEN